MSKELEQEFSKVIATVTKEVTESVVRDSALSSVNNLNESLKELKKSSPKLVKDIKEAETAYTNVSKHAIDNMQHFSDFISKWQREQKKLLKEISDRNDIVAQWLKQSDQKRFEDIKNLQKSTIKEFVQQNEKLQDLLNDLNSEITLTHNIEDQIKSNQQELLNALKNNHLTLSSNMKILKVIAGINFLILASLAGYTLKSLIGG
ncbi:MAG: hypothetical protein KHX20_01805 [Megasphaera sp.]|nr:hypothetical protein [Megasphaera sp.]